MLPRLGRIWADFGRSWVDTCRGLDRSRAPRVGTTFGDRASRPKLGRIFDRCSADVGRFRPTSAGIDRIWPELAWSWATLGFRDQTTPARIRPISWHGMSNKVSPASASFDPAARTRPIWARILPNLARHRQNVCATWGGRTAILLERWAARMGTSSPSTL